MPVTLSLIENPNPTSNPNVFATILEILTCIGGVVKGGPQAHPIFRTIKASVFSTNAQSRFASVVLDLCALRARPDGVLASP